jgi:hypothetical protein
MVLSLGMPSARAGGGVRPLMESPLTLSKHSRFRNPLWLAVSTAAIAVAKGTGGHPGVRIPG